MIALDTQRLFFDSPYPVTLDEGEYVVKTDHDIVYAVGFKQEPFLNHCLPIGSTW